MSAKSGEGSRKSAFEWLLVPVEGRREFVLIKVVAITRQKYDVVPTEVSYYKFEIQAKARYSYLIIFAPMFVRSGAPITGKIVPAFGMKENSRDKATTENKMGFWTRKVNAQLFNSPLDFTSASGTPIYLQFSIISEFNCPLPLRSHRITISRPDEDIFFHWVYECTYFSFQTLQAEMRWTLLGEDANDAAFSQFGDMMKEYISNCAIYPDRSHY